MPKKPFEKVSSKKEKLPICPGCGSKRIVSCPGGTCMRPIEEYNWLCTDCLGEWWRIMPRVKSREKTQAISIYGSTRRWKTRSDGVRQRYKYKYRIELRGKGKHLSQAYARILKGKLTPHSRHLKTSASAFNRRWRFYAYEDKERRQIDEVDSPKERERRKRDRWIFGR